MAKAKVKYPDGRVLDFEGTPEELHTFMEINNSGEGRQQNNIATRRQSNSIQGRIEQLILEDFFSQKRSINEVLSRLAEKGYIYKSNNISTPLLRLSRLGKLRRFKEGKIWIYVNP